MKNWARMRECTKMSCCKVCRTTLSRKLDGLALDDSLMYILAHITGMLGMKQLVYGTLLVTGWKNVRTWSGAVRLGLRLDEIKWLVFCIGGHNVVYVRSTNVKSSSDLMSQTFGRMIGSSKFNFEVFRPNPSFMQPRLLVWSAEKHRRVSFQLDWHPYWFHTADRSWTALLLEHPHQSFFCSRLQP